MHWCAMVFQRILKQITHMGIHDFFYKQIRILVRSQVAYFLVKM